MSYYDAEKKAARLIRSALEIAHHPCVVIPHHRDMMFNINFNNRREMESARDAIQALPVKIVAESEPGADMAEWYQVELTGTVTPFSDRLRP